MIENKYMPIVRFSGVICIVIGASVISGWLFNLAFLKDIIHGLYTMKFNTALSFLFVGMAVCSVACGKMHFYKIFSLLVLCFTSLILAQDIFGFNLGIDQLFVKDVPSMLAGMPFPGRLPPTTSVCFILITAFILTLNSNKSSVRIGAQYLLHLVSFISFLAIIGYLYDVPSFYKVTFFAPMAIHTALAFLVISISLSLLYPDTGITSLFSRNEIGNIVARRVFPWAVIMIAALGNIILASHRKGWISVEFGVALFTACLILVTLFIIANTARYINRIDGKRHEAESSVIQLNKTLEQRVKDRTEELQKSEEKFFKIFQMSPAGLIISDITHGRFLDVNQSFIDLTGYTKTEAMSKTTVELGLLALEDRTEVRAMLAKQGSVKNYEVPYYTKSGERKHALMSVEVIELQDMQLALTVLYDITYLKIIENDLKAARDIAEESSIAKERFMANMSHEIRTPMNAIIGFTNLVEKTRLNEEQEQYLHFIKTSGENLLVLINDILDYSKIEAGMMQLETIPFDIGDLVQSIEIMFSEKAREKKLQLIKILDPDLPDILIGDPTRLTQILINLIGNAIKFTSAGSVTIAINRLSATDDQCSISISVKDTGIGIPEDKQKDVFERFMQASSETTRNYGGTGLGLSIVKRLVEIQNGEISINSLEGEGAEFRIVMPYLIGKKELNDGTERSAQEVIIKKFDPPLSVLLAEDNIMNQMLARKVLSQFGCEVDVAENGGIAVEMLRNKPYDIVLMDIQMPITDGYAASKMIREGLKLSTPIIAMTAHVMSGEREKCISMGMTDYISKPFQINALYALIQKHTGKAVKALTI
jgi:PAS domain S-box-containing protein